MVVVPRAAAVAVAEEADGSYGRPMTRSVSIIEQGREGRVRYSEGGRSLDGYWEFGGGDVVAIVNAGTREDWSRMHPWAVEQRAGILRFIADEVIRQRAPACIAEIDEQRGDKRVEEQPVPQYAQCLRHRPRRQRSFGGIPN